MILGPGILFVQQNRGVMSGFAGSQARVQTAPLPPQTAAPWQRLVQPGKAPLLPPGGGKGVLRLGH